MIKRSVISLCDFSGVWSQPYVDAGYDVTRIDLQHGGDVRLVKHRPQRVHGILMAPPCDHFASSGARWWKAKGEAALLDGLSIVDACLRMVALYDPEWWALENPIGRLVHYLGKPTYMFDPCDHGDPYTKRTCLWGTFAPPPQAFPVEPTLGSKMHRMSSSHKNQRSETPKGFARAFFESNP